MKTLLVTSQVTYVPQNYQTLFEELVKRVPEHLMGVMILKNLSLKVLGQAAGLAAMGCTGIASHLFRNILELPLQRREKIFREKKLGVYSAMSMNDPQVVQWVQDEKIDLIVNVRTRCIYKKPILDAPQIGCINVHHGILPDYRGTLCDLYALWEGRRAGFTIHQMNEKIDAGVILIRAEISKPGEKDYVQYLSETGAEEGKILADLISQIAKHEKFPNGLINKSEKPIYTRNPTRVQIQQMRKEGMRL